MAAVQEINIIFPDDSNKKFAKGITGFEIAKSIAPSLAKTALAIKIDDTLYDLDSQINKDAKIEIITPKSGQIALDIIRHDAAHIMAQAVKQLYPDVQVTIGPAIENGFYYDFARQTPFSQDDLIAIEQKMHQISKANHPFKRKVMARKDAVKFFEDMGENYKSKIIADIDKSEEISLYEQGDFIDLCRGPHAPSTAHIKYFKLMKVAGAYWKGDSKNEMLQRIYGTAWESKESLDKYLHMIEEAKKRDHRKLGKQLDLFHIQDEATGSVFWHKNGWIIFREIEQYIRNKLEENDYIEVRTPQLVDRSLWEKSGHWDKFRENMFIAKSENRTLAVKPMNCPCHVQIFNQELKSYKQLPLRMAEFGSCHRNESSGSLHGIMRVRAFTQDDAHIFCQEDQINSETIAFCNMLSQIYNDFGFSDIKVKFSTRPEVRAGDDKTWDKSEKALEQAVKAAGLEYDINPGEGAFYGPKLEFILTDAIGRQWQCGTLQVDFILPKRLDASYIASDGSKKIPVMIHRAILGSFERFIGILIENFGGKFPLWLAPTQIMILTITNEFDDYALLIHKQLKDNKIRADIDLDSSSKISYKIRNYSLKKIPYIVVIGKKEVENKLVTIRKLGSNDQIQIKFDDFIKIINQEILTKNIE